MTQSPGSAFSINFSSNPQRNAQNISNSQTRSAYIESQNSIDFDYSSYQMDEDNNLDEELVI